MEAARRGALNYDRLRGSNRPVRGAYNKKFRRHDAARRVAMGAGQPVVKCPACGSVDVAAIPLFLIESRYYKCRTCVVTFRESGKAQEPADVERLNQAFADLYGPGRKPS